MQKTQWRSRTSSCKFRWLDNSRSQGPQRHLRMSKQSPTGSRGAGLSHSMDPSISVQNKNFTKKPREAGKSSWSRTGILKVIYTDNFFQFVKACEDLSWNHCRSETHGTAERAVRRVKEGTSAVLLQSGLNESWWADSMECYTYLRNVTDLLTDGKTPHERRFGQPFKGFIFPFGSLVEYHPITAKDQSRIHQFGKKVLPGLFLGYALYAGWIWNGDVLVADFEELETMDASEIYSKRLNAKQVIFPKKKENLFFQSQMDESNALEEIKSWKHPPWYGSNQFEEKVTLENQKGLFSTSRLVSGCQWSDKWFLVHVKKLHIPPSRWTQNQTQVAERRVIPYSTKIHWRVQNYTCGFECSAGEAHWWLLEHWWLWRLVWSLDRFHAIYSVGRKSSWRIYVVRVRDWQGNSLHPGQIIYGQSYGSQWESTPSWRRSKSGPKKRFILKTHENCVEFISSTPRIRNLRKPSRTQRKKLETSVAPAMPCKIMKKNCGSGGSDEITRQNLRVFWKLLNLRDCVWEIQIPNYHEDHIAGKGDNSLQHYNLVHKFIPMPQAMKIPAAKAAVEKEWEKLEKISAWSLTKVRSKKQVIDEARTSGATVHFASLMDICHLMNAELETKHQKYRGRVVLRGDIVKDDSGSYAVFTEQGSSASQMTAANSHGYHIQTARVRRTSSWRSICLYPGKNGGCSQIIENSKIGMPRQLDSSTTTQMA